MSVFAFTFVSQIGVELDVAWPLLETAAFACSVVLKHLLPTREELVVHLVVVRLPVGCSQVSALHESSTQVEILDLDLELADTLLAHVVGYHKVGHLLDPSILLHIVIDGACGIDHLHEVEFILEQTAAQEFQFVVVAFVRLQRLQDLLANREN